MGTLYRERIPWSVADCQIQPASRHAFPRGPSAVEDRQMSLTMPCHESASFTAHLLGAGNGRTRKDAPTKDFTLCENHEDLFTQIDVELISEGWASARSSRSTPLF